MTATTQPLSLRLDGILQVKLPVTDLESSMRWYHDLLGLRLWVEFVEDGVLRGAGMIDPDGRFNIALRDRAVCASNPDLAGFDVVAFAPHTPEVLDDLVEHCGRLGIPNSGVQQRPGGCWLDIPDPDGTVLRFYHHTDPTDRFMGVEFRRDAAPTNYSVPHTDIPAQLTPSEEGS